MKKAIVALCLLSLAGCKKNEPKKEQENVVVEQEKNSQELISGQYILTYSDSLQNVIKDYNGSNKYNNWEDFQSRGDKFVRELLKLDSRAITITGNTDVCLMIQTDMSEEKLKSQLRNTDIIAIQQNFTKKVNFPKAIVTDRQPNTELQWGVQRVSASSKPNGIYKNAWVVDTGIAIAHPDLNVNVTLSKSFVPGEDLTDFITHGTHVSGIIGAKANGNGVVGVAPNAPICALKVFDKNRKINMQQYLLALQYIINNGVTGDVFNLSMSSELTENPNETALIKKIAQKGIVAVIAAGNEGSNLDTTPRYPASLNGTNIYTVSSFDQADNFAPKSNYGKVAIDYALPGVKIYSTIPGGYGEMSGTSMAAPHLSGLLLLKRTINTDGNVKNDPDGKNDAIAHE